MAVQHSEITDPNIHEPKGASTAALGQVYAADGAGSGDWYIIDARGSVGFSNITTPLTITYPAAYTKVNPVTTASGFSREVTESASSQITYTGTSNKPLEIIANLYIDQSSGANKDIRAAIYKNGSIISLSEAIVTTVTASKVNIVLTAAVLAVTNDYFEVYIRNEGGSGDLKLYSFRLSLTGLGIQ